MSGAVPETFHLILYKLGGGVIARQTVSNNTRYRFNNLLTDQYVLVVECENQEVGRLHIAMVSSRTKEWQQDINLEWRGSPHPAGAGTASTIYARKPDNQTRFDTAQEAFKNKNYSQAASLLTQIVESDPKDFVALTELATVLSRQDKVDDAEKAYLRALAERATFLPALVNLGKLRIARKNFDGAIETLTKAVEAHPTSADAQLYLGEAYLQIKRGSKAVVHFNEAIKLDPVGKAEAHLRLAALYHAAGLKDRAAAEYEMFLSKQPNHPERKKLEQYISENKKK